MVVDHADLQLGVPRAVQILPLAGGRVASVVGCVR